LGSKQAQVHILGAFSNVGYYFKFKHER